jgi:4'-phosphopantetheinyl transferase
MTELTELLDAREHTRSTRLRNQNDRTHFIIAHAFARILLGRYLGCAPKAVRIGYGPNGKPHAIRSCGAPDIRFNASRSGRHAAFTFALGGDVGVDIEEVSDRIDLTDIVEYALSKGERHFIYACPKSEQRTAFFSLWVRKEAFLKACGSGFAVSPSDVETASDGRVSIKGELQGRWRVNDIALAPGYAAAVCDEGERPRSVVVREINFLTP